MKIMTILGTRPEIIRLSRIIPLLDSLCEHVVVNSSQNYEPFLNEIFFRELKLRQADYTLNCQAPNSMEQIAFILSKCNEIINYEQPDRILILGDTNTALSAIAARKSGIPVFHMEAGNRCYDDQVPEEVNRRIVDHCSDVLMPYTERSRVNLLREGIASNHIFVTGNPILEVLNYYQTEIEASNILHKLGFKTEKYFLITLHRAENVDVAARLKSFIDAFHLIHLEYNLPVLCSLHPRTRSQLKKINRELDGYGVITIEPPALFDFVKLEKNALCVLTDSGTVQEECCIFKIPSVTLRDLTERPETVECGSSIIAGSNPDSILNAVNCALESTNWEAPREYLIENVSSTAVRIILGQIPR